MKKEDIVNGDGHQFGNFKHYYEFHDASASRLQGIVPGTFWQIWKSMSEPAEFIILDVGCNEGDVTLELLKLAMDELPSEVKCVAYGIDIDYGLIEVARVRHSKSNMNTLFFVVDVMDSVGFQHFLQQESLNSIAIVGCLRVSMWIHLNYGDNGLIQLFKTLGSLPTKSLLIDPQKVSYYKKAINRNCNLGLKGFPYSLDDLSVSDISSFCFSYFSQNFGFSRRVERDISKWGGTLLFFLKERITAHVGDKIC